MRACCGALFSVSDVGATDGRACLHIVVRAPQQRPHDGDNKRLLFVTKAPSEVSGLCTAKQLHREMLLRRSHVLFFCFVCGVGQDDIQLLDSHSLASTEHKLSVRHPQHTLAAA